MRSNPNIPVTLDNIYYPLAFLNTIHFFYKKSGVTVIHNR